MYIKGYTDFSLEKAGILHSHLYGAHFKLDTDVRRLFPYINRAAMDSKYFDNPEYIQFTLDRFQCTLYPHDVIATAFEDKRQALKFVDQLINFLNQIYEEKGEILPDYKKIKETSVLDIYRILPQTNCRECGYNACLAFAGALSKGRTSPDKCPGINKPISTMVVYPIFNDDGELVSTVELETNIDEENDDRGPSEEQGSPEEPCSHDLTDRELEVLKHVALGLSNKEISAELCISSHTVKRHVVHIFNKLTVNDRTQAAVWATRHKLV